MKHRREAQNSPRWALWRWYDIPDGTDPDVVYLRRLRIVQTPYFGVYLHWIYLPDRDRDSHDHPWPFTSTVLRGGYTEEIFAPRARYLPTRTVFRAPRTTHRMRVDQAHRITTVLPRTVTLVVTGRRSRTWGFWTTDGFVPWTDYRREGTNPGPDPFDS